MQRRADVAQGDEREESLSAQVNVRLTESEKLDVKLLSALHAKTESAIVRGQTIKQIVEEASGIRNRDVA